MEVVECPRCESISGDSFASHVSEGDATPLLITHCAELHASAALQDWTLEGLCKRLGANQVNVRKIVDPMEYREGRRECPVCCLLCFFFRSCSSSSSSSSAAAAAAAAAVAAAAAAAAAAAC